MTREEAKELLPIIKAFAEGKMIQDKIDGLTDWVDTDEINLEFEGKKILHRIKPEPKYRPFKSKEECWNEMLKHHPFGWVIDKLENFQHLALVYSCDTNSCDSDNGDRVGLSVAAISIDFEQMLKEFKFADGTPFGIK